MTISRCFSIILCGLILAGCCHRPATENVPAKPGSDLGLSAGRASGQPVWELPPDNPAGITEQKLARQTAASLSRQLREAHSARGLPDPAAEDALSAFFGGMGAWEAKLPDALPTADLLAQAETLRAAPCDDPALLHCHGLLLQDAGRYPEAFDLFLQAAARYDQLDFPGILKARNAVAVYVVIHQIGDDHDKDQCFRWKDRALEFLAQGIARDSLRTEDLRPLYAHVHEHWTKIYWTRDGDSRHIVSRRIEELGGGEPWLVHMLLAQHEYRLAWGDRGGGFADTVTPEGWQGFAEHYEKAEAHCRAALALHPEFPEPINFLIDITAAGHNAGPETIYDWFQQAVRAQIDYWYAYQSLAFHTLPRWGGTPEQLLGILRMVSENKRFDTRLPQYALTLYKTIAGDRIAYPGPWKRKGLTVHPWRDPDGWAIVRRIYEGYLGHSGPIPYERDFLLMAYLNYAHQYDLPREFLRILEEFAPAIAVDPAAFERTHGYPLRLAEAQARLQIDQPEAWGCFARSLETREFAEAANALVRLASTAADSECLALLRRALWIRSELEPESGWIEHRASPTLYPWTEQRGTCRPAFAGAYLGQSQDQRNLILLNQATNGNGEIAADVAVLANATAADANAGLFIAKDKQTYVYFGLYPDRGEAVLARGQHEVRRVPVALEPPPARNRLRLRIEGDRFSAWVNGQPVFSGETFADFTWADAYRFGFGFGGLYPTAGATVLFENVRSRNRIATAEETP